MNESLIAARYAKALLNTGIEVQILPQLREDLKLIDATCRTEPRILQVMNSPSVLRETKLQLLKQLFGEKVSPYTIRFIETLLQRNRQQLLPDILRSFESQYNRHENIRQAVLTTASPVDEAQRQAVVRLLETRYRAHIELTCRINPDIIGGFVLNVDGDQYDAAVETALRRIQQNLMQ